MAAILFIVLIGSVTAYFVVRAMNKPLARLDSRLSELEKIETRLTKLEEIGGTNKNTGIRNHSLSVSWQKRIALASPQKP